MSTEQVYNENEKELLLRVAEGDEEAFAEGYARTNKHISKYRRKNFTIFGISIDVSTGTGQKTRKNSAKINFDIPLIFAA